MTTSGTLAGLIRGRWSATELLMLILLSVAFVFGGSPNEPGWRIALICFVSCALLAWVLAQGGWGAFRRLPGLTQGILLGFPLLWIAHMIPLPPGVWGLLPGRELPARIFELIGTSAQFHPLSVMPRHTLFGFVMMLPAISLFAGALMLDERGRARVVAAFLILVVISILAGLVQLTSRGALLNFYDTAHHRNLLGFFANRNHQGLMLAFASLFAAVFISRAIRDPRKSMAISALVALALITAAIGTLSRAGLALTLTAIVLVHLFLYAKGMARSRMILIGVGLLAALALLYGISLNPVVERAITRFGDVGEDGRWEIWRMSIPLISQYFPWGSGLGTYAESYKAIELLDNVDTSYLNHFHNDYMELLAEAGLPGMVLVLLFGMLIAKRIYELRDGGWAASAWAMPSVLTIGLVALHAIVDYPLRTQAIAALFGLSLAFFLASPAARDNALQGQLNPNKRGDA